MSAFFTRITLGLPSLCTVLLALAAPAAAATIQIPAIAFVTRAVPVSDLGDANAGVLTNAEGSYFAAVPFAAGQQVCKFTLVHRDNDADSQIVARLYKKKVIIGDTPFTPPVRMTFVATGVATGTMGVKRKSSTVITEPVITIPGAFYYVELQNTSGLLEVLGVEIDVRPAC